MSEITIEELKHRILENIKQNMPADRPYYIRTRHINEEIGTSTTTVGKVLSLMSREETGYRIMKHSNYGYWRIEPLQDISASETA